MAKLVFGAAFLVALVTVSLPLHAQVEHRNVTLEEGKNVTLNVCNAGKVDIDVLVAKANPVVTTHILPNTCAPAYSDIAGVPAYVGFALVDSHGQWGTVRRLDFLPDLGVTHSSMSDALADLGLGGSSTSSRLVINNAARNVSVRRGNQDVPAQLQLSFRPSTPGCSAVLDSKSPHAGEVFCDRFVYNLIAVAYPESREISFLKGCTDCYSHEMPMSPEQRKKREELPQRQEWSDLLPFLYKSANRPVALPKNIVIRGTISRVDTALPGASEPWVNVYFSESPDRMFDVCSSNPDILKDLFGADFRTSMIGKTVEVEGDIQRRYCDGRTGSIRVTLARQVHPPGSARVEVAPTIALKVPPTPAAAPFQQQPYLDPSMPNYDVNASARILQICRGLYDPFGSRLTAEQIRIKNTNRAAIEAEVQTCVSSFDAAEARAHRRIAMHYCLGKNDLTAVLQGARAKAYDECMRQNDVLTELCTRELKYHGGLNEAQNLADNMCPAPEPNGREIGVMRNGGHDDAGKPVVVPSKGPGLPTILLAPLEPGIIRRAGVTAANPAPAPAPGQPAQPASARAASGQAVPPAPPAGGIDAIIELVKGGMSEALLIKTIQRQAKAYDLTPAETLKLQKAGVSEKIIDALLDREPAPAAATPAPATVAQQQRQQQAAERQKQAQKYAACQQQAVKDHPEGGIEVVKAVTSCSQAK